MSENRKIRGFSLVEMMVAVLIGSLVVLAASQLFLTNQRTFLLQQGLTDVQEQGRFAMDFIARDLRRMGMRQPGVISGPTPGIVRTPVTVNGVTFAASEEGGASVSANDRLTFAYQANTGAEDCEGGTLGAPGAIVNTYWVNNNAQLVCRGSVDAGTTGIVIVDGVDSFQVLYGVDTVQDGVPFAARYVTAGDLGADDEVVTVRVGLLVRASQQNLPPMGDPLGYVVLDKSLTPGEPPLERPAIRRLFVTTVRARNVSWERI